MCDGEFASTSFLATNTVLKHLKNTSKPEFELIYYNKFSMLSNRYRENISEKYNKPAKKIKHRQLFYTFTDILIF